VVILVGVLSGYAVAQQAALPAGKPETAPPDSQAGRQVTPAADPEKSPSGSKSKPCSGFSLCQFHPEDLKAGVFWGAGSLTVDRLVAPGPVDPWGLLFGGFKHRTDTDLNDTFLAFEGGFRWGDKLSVITGLDTNIGRENQFRQATDATAGQTSGIGYNGTLGLLYLPNNTRGFIALPDKNSIWDWDQGFALRLKPKLQFLLGWKYSSINDSPGSCYATVPKNTFLTFPGMGGWGNYWADTTMPSTTGFSFAQRVWWTGPYLGAQLRSGDTPRLLGQWYIQGKFAPYVWGDYKLAWRGSYRDPVGGFIVAQEATQTGLSGYMLELKAGTQFRLAGNLYLEIWAKYMHLNMTGSGHEMQAWQTSFASLNPIWQPVAQQTIAHITVNQNLWAIGPNLIYRF
jgi:hypothetical protein